MSSRYRPCTDNGAPSGRRRSGARSPSRSSPPTFFLESLGCAKNQVDSELMIAALLKAGWSRSEDPAAAGVLIVNTCGFIDDAKKESIETTLALKERYPNARVIMAGCLSERYGEDLAAQMPEIDGFMGNRDPGRIVALAGSPGRMASQRGRSLDRPHLLSYPGSAYVKVAEGCGNRCTYCAIPLIRGDLASRERRDVVEEIRRLLDGGIRELVLIAQDLGSFGRDRGAAELPLLLEDIGGLPGSFWVRLLYIHPDHFPAGLLDVVRGDPRFLPYFDLPFQHASPPILAAMGRKPDAERNLALVSEIRSRLPGAVVRSTFLVGFPGETEEDFQRLLSFQELARLDWMGAFAYSREEGTPAWRMGGRVTKREAARRKGELERRQGPITEQALDRQVGRTLDVLVEERVQGEGMSLGRAYLQAPDVDGLVLVRAAAAPGEMVRVRITRRNGIDLEGDVIGR